MLPRQCVQLGTSHNPQLKQACSGLQTGPHSQLPSWGMGLLLERAVCFFNRHETVMRSLATWSPSNLPREQHCKPPTEASCCSLAAWKPRMPHPSLGRFFVIATMTVSKDWCGCAWGVGVGWGTGHGSLWVRKWPMNQTAKSLLSAQGARIRRYLFSAVRASNPPLLLLSDLWSGRTSWRPVFPSGASQGRASPCISKLITRRPMRGSVTKVR